MASLPMTAYLRMRVCVYGQSEASGKSAECSKPAAATATTSVSSPLPSTNPPELDPERTKKGGGGGMNGWMGE